MTKTVATGGREYRIRAVMRALDVLIALGELGRADLTTVARAAGLHPTTALRMLESLRSRSFVRQRDGRYEIGPRAFEIGSRFPAETSLAADAQPLLEQLAASLMETASLGILESGEILYLAIAHGQRELGIQSMPGVRHPAHCTALGKVLLAHLPWDRVERILAQHPPVRLTPATIVELDALHRELDQVRRKGFAADAEERVPGVVCVGAPVRDHSGGVVAAISVSGPRLRISARRVAEVADEVMATAGEISAMLGAPDREEVMAPGQPRPS